jgi:hypothetical protein
MFGKKTGITILKEKLEIANKHLITAAKNMIASVEELNKAQEIHNEFYKLLFELESFKGVDGSGIG